jgi:hypothetical protein
MSLECATILLATFTFVLALVTAFQDSIRAWLRRPKLTLATGTCPPEAHKTVTVHRTDPSISAECYYFLLRVENSGNSRAENVEVFAKRLSRKQADGTFSPVDTFLPMNLLWSFSRTPILQALPPGFYKHCSLGHIINPARSREFPSESAPDSEQKGSSIPLTTLVLDVEFLSNARTHLLSPGTYRLELSIGAANSKARDCVLTIGHTGIWYSSDSDMLSRGVSLSLEQ